MGNIDVKLHHLVWIWASASAHLKESFRMPIEWGTPSWDGLMTELDWLESSRGFMSGFTSAKRNITRHEITVWTLHYGGNHAMHRVSIALLDSSGSGRGTHFCEARSFGDLIGNDKWLHSRHERLRDENAARYLHWSYSKPSPWCNVSRKQQGEV